ncbi:6-phosphogluconolactonase [Stigmatella aurantiaca]|uniref:6-phosphogluconolactonase n=1 Tax=Stigmatella aurantiaca (strain DW4/3-1) TaxID=378806 RepID=Q08ZT9_STIAD|nr:6-phosphogluconolactonase [Stigmatella aurantiaca]ADO74796.1 6-phosphogluconolactonase [Stigmatella aurantiaca DW4/3-1]EAU65974.1 6-phosphogluconolactonase [Stigmatella aurantiaca DW4/3-1]
MSRPAPLVVASEALAGQAADWLAEALRQSLAGGGRCSLALSGGRTTGPIYRTLAQQKLPWERVDFFFADERCVPPEHPESNFLLVEENLLRPLRIPSEQVHRMEGEREDRDAAARDYAAVLPPVLDVVLLGMGEDGHTASLFPGHTALEERERRVLAVVGPKPPPWRLTLTLPVLNAARRVLFAVAGEGKQEAVRRVFAGEELPAARVTNAVWLLDRTAAGQ